MSWITDDKITYLYKCASGHVSKVKDEPLNDPPEVIDCTEGCGDFAAYVGFEPRKLKQTTIVEYEKNGVKALEIRSPDGIRCISKTKQNYIKTGKIKNEYSKAYQEHLEKTNQTEMLEQTVNTRRAKVSKADPSEMLKDMPDGEYVSDGVNVMPAPKLK